MSVVVSGRVQELQFVTVIIPTHNDSYRLKKCLLSLQNQSYPFEKYEIIVVDNRSTEDIFWVIQGFDHIKVLREDELGSYQARNRGIRAAMGHILAFTDSDCVASREWIEEGVKYFRSDPSVGIVGGEVLFYFRANRSPNAYELYDSNRYMRQERCIKNKKFSVTANMFVRRSVFDEVGLFNAEMKSGGDAEWGQRANRHGYEIVYGPSAVVFHPARYSFRQIYTKTIRVAEGLSNMEYGTLKPTQVIRRIVSNDIAPPLNRIIEIYAGKQFHGVAMKTKIAFLTLIFKYITTWCKVCSYTLR